MTNRNPPLEAGEPVDRNGRDRNLARQTIVVVAHCNQAVDSDDLETEGVEFHRHTGRSELKLGHQNGGVAAEDDVPIRRHRLRRGDDQPGWCRCGGRVDWTSKHERAGKDSNEGKDLKHLWSLTSIHCSLFSQTPEVSGAGHRN